jgi:hypothetical protein
MTSGGIIYNDKKAVQNIQPPYSHQCWRSGRFPALPYPPNWCNHYNKFLSNNKKIIGNIFKFLKGHD